MKTELKRDDLIYPELAYRIIGVLFSVWKELSFGHRESVYQKSVSSQFKKEGVKFTEQVYKPVKFNNENVGKNFFDFLIDDKIVLEIKVRNYFSKNDIDQLYSYLKSGNYKLGIIAHFTRDGVKFKRVVNIL